MLLLADWPYMAAVVVLWMIGPEEGRGVVPLHPNLTQAPTVKLEVNGLLTPLMGTHANLGGIQKCGTAVLSWFANLFRGPIYNSHSGPRYILMSRISGRHSSGTESEP
jgi:hypothetical protein